MKMVRYLMKGKRSTIHRYMRQYDSFEDWPWILLYRDIDKWFPETKFVLTTRDETEWLHSYRKLLARSKATGDINEIRSFLYGLRFPNVDDTGLLKAYKSHY